MSAGMDIAAAAVGFVTLAVQLTNAVADYAKSVSNYPKTLDAFIAELATVKGSMERFVDLKKHHSDRTNVDTPIETMINKAQPELKKFLKILYDRLEALRGKDEGIIQKAKARLLWPLTERDVNKYLKILQQYSSHIVVDVVIDNQRLGVDANQKLDEMGQSKQEKQLRIVLQWLSNLEIRQKHDFRRAMQSEGTGQWIFYDERYAQWVGEAVHASVLWLSGMHGSGKTVLMASIISKIILSYNETSEIGEGAFIYCTFEDEVTTNPTAILRSILVQLLRRGFYSPDNASAKRKLKKFADRMDSSQGPPEHSADLISDILEASMWFPRTVVAIDGLDEIKVADREELIPRLLRLPKDSEGRIKLVISSRPERDIEDLVDTYFEELQHCGIANISLEAESTQVNSDLAKYIQGRLESDRPLKKLPENLKQQIFETLMKKKSFFQLAKLQLDEIRECTLYEIPKRLADLPRDLDKLYIRILQRILNSGESKIKLAKRAFTWLAAAKQPLTLQEVVEALTVDPTSAFCDPQALREDRELLEICGSLVKYDEYSNELTFSHFSVKEFFLTNASRQQPPRWSAELSCFFVDAAKAEKYLAMSILTYFMFEDVGCQASTAEASSTSSGSSDSHSDSLSDLDCKWSYGRSSLNHGLLNYAARNWNAHVKAAAVDGSSDEDIMKLIRRLFLDSAYTENYKLFLWMQLQIQSVTIFEGELRRHLVEVYSPTLSPLYYPILYDLPNIVKDFINLRPHWLNEPIDIYGTPLLIATGQNNVDMINCLLDLGADIEKTSVWHAWDEIRPISYAAAPGRSDAMETLLGRGAKVNTLYQERAGDAKGVPPLHEAARWGLADMTKLLLEHGSDIQERDRMGRLVLEPALLSASLETIKILCEHGSDPNEMAQSGKTIIKQALELRNGPIICYLLEHIKTIDDAVATTGDTTLADYEWAEMKDWYPHLVDVVKLAEKYSTRTSNLDLDSSDVYHVYWILHDRHNLKLPKKLALSILDIAEMWIKISVENHEPIVVNQYSLISPYVSITAHGPLRKLSCCTTSHDQGWCSEPTNMGRYTGSMTWFEVGIIGRYVASTDWHEHGIMGAGMSASAAQVIQRNVCADGEYRTHYNEWKLTQATTPQRREWFESIGRGDVIALYARALYPGWVNHVKHARVDLWFGLA